jgi:hypothetical protein
MSDSTAHNLLVGSWDLSTAVWYNGAKRSDKTFWGAAVADIGIAGEEVGIYFPNDAHRADARVTSGAEYVLSFFARADVAGDKIHSDVWGSKYMLDTELTTEWQQVVMPYGIVNADHREVYFHGLGTNSGTVHAALPMCVRGTEPAAWAPAEGETLAGGGALMSANLWDVSAANFKPDTDGVYNVGKTTGELDCSIAGASALTENQTIHMSASLRGADKGCLKPFVEYRDAEGNLNWVGFPHWTPTDQWQRFDGSCVVPSGMTITRIGFNTSGATGNMEVLNPTFSYGGPVTLTSAEHTHQVPYVPVLYTYETDVPSKVELTYTDASFHDVGVLVPSSGDFAWGTDENDFSIDVYGTDLPERGGLLYAEGSDVGGVVRGFESETDNELFSIVGDTWTGVLERHVIGPPSGSDYLTISGEARDCVAQVVALTGLTSLYVVDEHRTGISFTHTFTGSRDEAESDAGRYMGAWSAIWQMMLDHGLSVSFAWDGAAKKVRMVVGRRADRTSDEEQQAGVSKLGITRKDVTNHLVCLGQGNLRNRTRVDLYIDAKGNVSKTQTFRGLDELADVYDDSAAEDAAKLEEDGRKKFAEIWKDHEQITDTASKGLQLNLGDLVGGTDERSGISATAIISKRVLSFSDGVPSYTYTTTVRSR